MKKRCGFLMICGLLLLVVPALADDVNTVETLLKDKTEAVLGNSEGKGSRGRDQKRPDHGNDRPHYRF